MVIDAREPRRNYPIPSTDNDIADDFGRLITALTAIGVDVDALVTAVAGKAPLDHVHPRSAITGLVDALAAKAAADHTHALSGLSDVAVAAAAAYQVLALINGAWRPWTIDLAHVTGTGIIRSDTTQTLDEASRARARDNIGAVDQGALATAVAAAVAALVGQAPATLDTLRELAAALGNDPAFATTMTAALGTKLAASAYTASDVLAKIRTVDGTGSGLDADVLRGVTPTTLGLSLLAGVDAPAVRSALGIRAAATVTPESYGAVGDGVTDDTAALGSALTSGAPVLLAGRYLITSAISVSLASRDGLFVQGTGSNSKIIIGDADARIVITGADVDNPIGTNSDQIVLRDFHIEVACATAVDILTLSAANGDSGSSMPGLDLSNVHIVPSAATYGTTGRNFVFNNMRNGRVRGCSAFGPYFAYSGIAFDFTAGAGSAPVEIDVSECNAAHVQMAFHLSPSTGASANDDWQGFSFTKCRGIAVDRGIWASTGSEAFSEWLTVAHCHFYFREIGIYAPSVRRPFFAHNYLLAHGALSASQGINTDIATGAAQYGHIDHNHVSFEACTAATRIGLYVQSAGSSYNRTNVSDNMVVSATTPYSLSPAAYTHDNQSV
jgi:hypothetical protein